jgi:hypothetical protein
VEILTTALPGFRHLRAPLIAGYLWLVFLWILIKPDIHKRPTNGVAAAVYDLAKEAGPLWVGLGVGVAVYLVGAVSQALSPVIGHKALHKALSTLWARLVRVAAYLIGRVSQALSPRCGHKALSTLQQRLLRLIAKTETDPMQRYVEEAQQKLGIFPKPRTVVVNPKYDEFLQHVSAARRGLDAELELPATLLLGKDPDPQLFSEADRLKAERELRLAVVPPLSFIFGFLGWNQSFWWWLALIGVAVLLWQGHSRALEFRSVMKDAVVRGLARSRSIDELRRQVDALPPVSSPRLGGR